MIGPFVSAIAIEQTFGYPSTKETPVVFIKLDCTFDKLLRFLEADGISFPRKYRWWQRRRVTRLPLLVWGMVDGTPKPVAGIVPIPEQRTSKAYIGVLPPSTHSPAIGDEVRFTLDRVAQ